MAGIQYTTENLNVWEPTFSINRGDHLAVEFEINGIKYHQHGIFLGPEKGVAVFGGTNNEIAQLSIVNFLTFINTGTPCLTRCIYPSCLPPDVTVRNAEFLFHYPQCAVTQQLLQNNCIHIAKICKTSDDITIQITSKINEYIQNSDQYWIDLVLFLRTGVVR